ncbi:hypothetical protein Tco_0409364 [Tanacetum coccineum]
MTGDKSKFKLLDETIKSKVHLGNGKQLQTEGKGMSGYLVQSVQLKIRFQTKLFLVPTCLQVEYFPLIFIYKLMLRWCVKNKVLIDAGEHAEVADYKVNRLYLRYKNYNSHAASYYDGGYVQSHRDGYNYASYGGGYTLLPEHPYYGTCKKYQIYSKNTQIIT